MKQIAWSLIVFVFFSAACGDEEPEPNPIDNTTKKSRLLTSSDFKRWKMVKETLGGVDVTQGYPICELDNFHVFHIAGTSYVIDAGDSYCPEPNKEPAEKRGSYSFNADTTALDISFNDTTFTAKLMELTESRLVWQVETNQGVYENTFKAQ